MCCSDSLFAHSAEVNSGRKLRELDEAGRNAGLSSGALELAGIDATIPDPPQRVVVRDPDAGEPSGTLRYSAMMQVAEASPVITLLRP